MPSPSGTWPLSPPTPLTPPSHPIGLTESGPSRVRPDRQEAAKPRGPCVFPAPIRDIFGAKSYEVANQLSILIQGKGISRQTFAILPRIKEVDDLLAKHPDLQRKLFEVHPELCFAAWSGSPESPTSLEPKRTLQGQLIRTALVATHFGQTALVTCRQLLPRGTFAEDDLLDAFTALWTANRIQAWTARRCPSHWPSVGIDMAMWY